MVGAAPGVDRLSVLLAALLFATGGVAIKAVPLAPLSVAAGRSLCAALFLFCMLPSWRRCLHPRALAVGTAYAATLTLFVFATKLTTSANAIFLQSTGPLYVLLLAPRLLGEPNRRGDWSIAGLLFAGLLCFFLGTEQPRASAPDPASGNLIATFAGLTWAATIMGLRWLGKSEPEAGRSGAGEAALAGNLLVAGLGVPLLLGALPGVLDVPWTERAPGWSHVGLGGFLGVLYLGVFQTGVAYVLLERGVRNVRASEVSMLLLVEPVCNAALAALVYAEIPGLFALFGCALVLVATVLLAFRSSN